MFLPYVLLIMRGRIVSARKPYKNYDETADRHAGEESMVVAKIAFPPSRRPLFSVQGSHSPSATLRLSRQDLIRSAGFSQVVSWCFSSTGETCGYLRALARAFP
jgi:hypothetical protein